MFKKIHALYIVSFLASFLLFQIELIVAKIFLPKFGGSFLVWGGCVVFFQCVLLLGYLYSHLVAKIWGSFRYSYFHLLLILLPLAVFPGRPLAPAFAHDNVPLVVDIFIQLIFGVGLVFFVLSTISVISQSWLASSGLPERKNPYVLYAVSNAGSFLGLLTYPFVFEANFGLHEQLIIWRICYVVFVLCYFVAFKIIPHLDKTPPEFKLSLPNMFSSQIMLGDIFGQKFIWMLLSAAGCIAFLSVTNIITYEIAPCPLLWIIPLGIYLISFTLTFREKPLYPTWIKDNFHLVLGFSVLLFFLTLQKVSMPILVMLTANLVSLFAVCMYCQYELYISRPKNTAGLTFFYFMISFGGFLGSLFAVWIAPVIFTSTYEYLFALFLISVVYLFNEEKKKISLFHIGLIACLLLLMYIWPLAIRAAYNFLGLVVLLFAVKAVFTRLKINFRSISLCMGAVFCISLFIGDNWKLTTGTERNIYAHRNYYGIYRVSGVKDFIQLQNGSTTHGVEYFSNEKQDEPLSYYHRKTPVGKILESPDFIFHHIGAIGLGVGTVSAYGKDGQVMDFFELDKDVYWIAAHLFHYLSHTKARTSFILGDARISLKNVADGTYDLLIVDAFTGDYVPVHLLTANAILEYKRCLKKDGVILFHVSNRSVDLAPVLFSDASIVKAYVMASKNTADRDWLHMASSWVALTWDKGRKDALVSKLGWMEDGFNNVYVRKIRPWTDDYTNLLPLIKINYLFDDVRNYLRLSFASQEMD
jgi:spermidine synthase